MLADQAIQAFILYEWREAQRLSYPKQAAFANHIARGTVALPTPTADDPMHEDVARFYHNLGESEQAILQSRYMPDRGTRRQRARSLGMSVRTWHYRVNRLLRNCMVMLADRGYCSRSII